MESSTPSLSIESFSHSWLANLKPSALEGLDKSSCSTSFDAADDGSFIEMDPKMPPSRRFSRVPKDFSFDFRASQLPPMLADPDDLISADGVLIPLFGNKAPDDGFCCGPYEGGAEAALEGSLSQATTSSTAVVTMSNQKEKHSSNRVRCASLRRCKRLSKRILQKYFDFLMPLLCLKLRGHGSRTSRVASVGGSSNSRARGVLLYERHVEYYSPATSPRTSVAQSSLDNWRPSCDSESSIYEAVLHCKSTHGR